MPCACKNHPDYQSGTSLFFFFFGGGQALSRISNILSISSSFVHFSSSVRDKLSYFLFLPALVRTILNHLNEESRFFTADKVVVSEHAGIFNMHTSHIIHATKFF